MRKIAALTFGTLMGGFGRYYLSGIVYRLFGSGFPFGTLAVNLIGCFLIGFFFMWGEERSYFSPELRTLLMIGFCGAFTTFSTCMLETGELLRDGQVWQGIANIGVSVIGGFIVFRLGVLLGQVL